MESEKKYDGISIVMWDRNLADGDYVELRDNPLVRDAIDTFHKSIPVFLGDDVIGEIVGVRVDGDRVIGKMKITKLKMEFGRFDSVSCEFRDDGDND